MWFDFPDDIVSEITIKKRKRNKTSCSNDSTAFPGKCYHWLTQSLVVITLPPSFPTNGSESDSVMELIKSYIC